MAKTRYNVGKYKVDFGDESTVSPNYNPNTGSGTYSDKQQQLINQFNTGSLSDEEQVNLIKKFGGRVDGLVPLPAIIKGRDGVVSSTKDYMADMNNVKNDAGSLISGIGDMDSLYNQAFQNLMGITPADTYDAQGGESQLADLAKSLGIFNSDEEQQIKDEGQAAYDKYVPQIQEAEGAKRQGLPKAVIGGGERGGFMSTQISGSAALRPTEGGTFLGEGGELNRIKSDYDRNIAQIKAAANSARLAAEASARQALRTGKRQDYEIAEKAHQRQIELSNQAIQLANDRVNAISNYLGQQQSRDINVINTLQNIPEGETVTIGGKTYTGKKINEIAPFFKSSDLVSIMKDTPEGETKEITDPNTGEVYTLTGMATNNPNNQIFESEDASGNVSYTTIDKNTGEIIGQVDAGRIGKGRAPSNTNSDGLTPEEKAFVKEKDSVVERLATGDIDWGEAYNILTGKYPDTMQRLDSLSKEEREQYKPKPGDETIADIILNKSRYVQ